MGRRFSIGEPEIEKSLNVEAIDIPKKEAVVTYAVVDSIAVNVRNSPSPEAESVDILRKGDKVQLGPTEGDFTFIFYGYDYHKAGYMMSKYLKVAD